MVCQPVLRIAKRQLLSLYFSVENKFPCKYETQRPPCERLNSVVLTAARNHKSLRCYQSAPSPPPIDENSYSNRATSETREEQGSPVCHESQSENKDNHCGENEKHVPIMVEEVLSCLGLKNNQLVVDMTFGAGGHAKQLLKSSPNICYIGVDRDPLAFSFAQKFAANYRDKQVTPLLSKFSELPVHLERIGVVPGTVDCFLMDLGVSSMQFDTASRGFGVSRDGPLDMRMDGLRFSDSPTAADVVNTLEPHDLARILKKYGEEKMAKAISHAIVEARYAFGKFTRTKQLADVIKAVFDSQFRHDKLHRHSHVATKTFQALRIFVNDELNELHNGLEVAHHYLKPNGRCAVISFHSLEDRIVKRHFHGIDMDLNSNTSIRDHFRNSRVSYDNAEIKEKFLSREWLPLRRKVLEPSMTEVANNPRSRSAKLRAAVKVMQN